MGPFGKDSPTGTATGYYVGVEIPDAQGRRLPEAEQKVRLSIDGPAELIGFGSANPLATGTVRSPETLSFRGRALAILRGTGSAGTVRIAAQAEGLAGATTVLRLA